MAINNNLFVETYKPKTFDDLVLDEKTKNQILSALENGKLPNMIFAGPAGIGKTTLATLIANKLNAETLRINCAVDGNVASAQNKLIPFCNAMSFDGRHKVVILDELDSASGALDAASTFQKSLRNIIESAQDDTLFIGTCNYEEKIIGPVKSRMPIIHLSFTDKDLLKRLVQILNDEKIEYTKESLKDFIKAVMVKCYPDIRSILHYLQMSCANGVLEIPKDMITNVADKNFIDQLISQVKNSNNILEVRQFYMREKMKIDDYPTVASQVYNYVIDNEIVTDVKHILLLSDIVYKISVMIDKEVGFFYLLSAIYDSLH